MGVREPHQGKVVEVLGEGGEIHLWMRIPVAFDPILSPGSGRDQGTGDASGVALMSLINILG